MKSPENDAAIILDHILTGINRAGIYAESRQPLREMVREALRDMDRGEQTDAYDDMLKDVLIVFGLHLHNIGDTPLSQPVTRRINLAGDLKDYKILQRKVAHGCTDASCNECDTL